jgi:hypothetical protein
LVEMLWYGKRRPAGLVRLSSSIFTTDASAMTARLRSAAGEEARRMRPWNGEAGSRFSRSQSAEGSRFAARFRGSEATTSGRSSVISPRGSGRVLFTRRNWSRWSAASSATKAFTGTGESNRPD